MKKLLLIGNLNNIFTFEFLTEVLEKLENCQISILTSCTRQRLRKDALEYCERRNISIDFAPTNAGKAKRRIPHFDVQWHNFWRFRLCRGQDIILVHMVPSNAAGIVLFAPRAARVVVSYYGSDLLRAGRMQLFSHSILLRRANQITVATEYMKNMLSQRFHGDFNYKVTIANFGAKAIESLLILKQQKLPRVVYKRRFGFPEDKLSVYIGYNGSKAQRHIPITRLLATLTDAQKQCLYLVYFCSYGLPNEQYLAEIEEALDASGIMGKVVREYLTGEELASFRMAADIMLNMQPTDAFSASMQEHLEAGTIVIKGDWLVYPELDELCVKIVNLSRLDVLPEAIDRILENLEWFEDQAKQNKGLVYQFLSWTNKLDSWLTIVTDGFHSNGRAYDEN